MSAKSIRLTFVYKNLEEVVFEGEEGESIFDLAVRNDIQMSPEVRGTCLVQIQSRNKAVDGLFEANQLAGPTQQELQILSPEQLESGYRYADTYRLDASLGGALVFLNIYRVYYKKRNGETIELNPYEGELLIGVKKRRPADIDAAYSCGGSMGCVSCHCILDVTEEEFSKIKRPVCDIEADQLDWADRVMPTSRLGCQVMIDKSIQWDKKTIRNPYYVQGE